MTAIKIPAIVLRAASLCAAEDSIPPTLDCIHLRKDGSVEATDGRIWFCAKSVIESDENYCIRLSKPLPDSLWKFAELLIDEKKIRFRTYKTIEDECGNEFHKKSGWKTIAVEITSNEGYPNTDRLVPTPLEDGMSDGLRYNAKLLSRTLNAFGDAVVDIEQREQQDGSGTKGNALLVTPNIYSWSPWSGIEAQALVMGVRS